MYLVPAISTTQTERIAQHIDAKTKPVGSLGQLETLALQLCRILGETSPQITQPTQLVFAGDHGVSEMGVSIATSDVTGQMVANFCNGGAAINAFCRQANMTLKVIDCGTVNEQPEHPRLIKQRIASITQPMHLQSAMTITQARQGIDAGIAVAKSHIADGANVIGIGEMGIGNSTAAAAILYTLTDNTLDECVGLGTGIDETTLALKKDIVADAISLHQDTMTSPLSVLACLGGFEIAQMVGAMIGTAQAQKVILVDGFITTAAALIAVRIAPNTRDYMVFSHQSKEMGHQHLLTAMNATPLLSLELRLGEGSGCPLALPLLQSALAFYNEMASFEQANVTPVNDK